MVSGELSSVRHFKLRRGIRKSQIALTEVTVTMYGRLMLTGFHVSISLIDPLVRWFYWILYTYFREIVWNLGVAKGNKDTKSN